MTRKRHYVIVAGILAGCVVVVLGVLAMLPSRAGVTKAGFDRIEEGMTLAEVEAILAGPPRVDLDLWSNKNGGTGLAWWFDTEDWNGARVIASCAGTIEKMRQANLGKKS